MKATDGSIGALRALGALVLLRALKPAALIAAILLFAGYALTIMLSLSFSGWWLLLLVLLVPLTVIVATLGLVLWAITRRLLPRKLTKTEQDKLHKFTDTVLAVTERAKTPYPLLLFLIAKDVIRRRESTFVRGLIGDSESLMKDFGEIRRMF